MIQRDEEMLELYLDQGENLIQTLAQAVKEQSVKDIHFMAISWEAAAPTAG